MKLESAKRYQFQWNKTTKDIETRYIDRTVNSTLDSRRDVVGYDTKPFGFKKQKASKQPDNDACVFSLKIIIFHQMEQEEKINLSQK